MPANLKIIFSLLITGLIYIPAFSQLTQPIDKEVIFGKYKAKPGQLNDTYYIIQKQTERDEPLPGSRIIRNIDPYHQILKFDSPANLPAGKTFLKLAPANSIWKLSPPLESIALYKVNNAQVWITVSADTISALLDAWKQINFNLEIKNLVPQANAALIKCSPAFFVQHLIDDPHLLFADLFISPAIEVPVIGYNRTLHQVNYTQYFLPNVNGRGINIGIKENTMDALDMDLQRRVISSSLASTIITPHASQMATLAGGAGNSFYTGRGLADHAGFYPSSFSNLFPDNTNTLLLNGVSVQNHSYGTAIQNFYGAEAAAYDVQTRQSPELLHVFSSGNQGQAAAPQGPYFNLSGFANLTGNFKMAKNIITVAALDTAGNLVPFSSAGPLFDGRLGPQLTALGPNGTSDAAAIVSGAIAIMQQVYKDSNNQTLPPADLLKAILYNTADDIGNPGIDFRSGFGSLNVYKAVELLRQKTQIRDSLFQNGLFVKNIAVPSQAANLKIMLTWTDTAATINTNKAIVNDLDLELTELNTGNVYLPWVLSSSASPDSLKKLPVRKKDTLNTVEQVSLSLPAAGQYEIRVKGSRVVTSGKQSFSIVYNHDTLNTFRFISPVTAADINREEDPRLSIKWKTVLSDTNSTGNLAISYNNGITWNSIAIGVALKTQQFSWPLPDTSVIAQLRMTTGFGNFTSNRFVIAPLTKLNVGFLCNDSVQLTWPPHFNAGAYQLFVLTDSPYLKPLLTLTDTMVTLQRSVYNGNVYALEPVLTSAVPAARSVAIDIRNQGVQCYYRTLLAENRINSIELILTLGTLSGIDSLIFERLNANGSLERTIGSVIPGNQFSHSMFDLTPRAGANYYRVRIRLKNGGQVFTETVVVIFNGNSPIIFYPNPVRADQPLNYQLRELGGSYSLQIVDMAGRIAWSQGIGFSGTINLGKLSAGIYFYRLLSESNKNLQSGKLVIIK